MYGDEPTRAYPDEERGPDRTDEGRGPGRTLPAPRVPEYLDRLDKGLMLLAEQIERAESSLAPVLRPDRPHPVNGEGGSPDRPDASDLAMRVDSMAGRALSLGHRLSEALDRLDL